MDSRDVQGLKLIRFNNRLSVGVNKMEKTRKNPGIELGSYLNCAIIY